MEMLNNLSRGEFIMALNKLNICDEHSVFDITGNFDKNTNVESNEVTTKAEISGKLYTFKTDNNVFS